MAVTANAHVVLQSARSLKLNICCPAATAKALRTGEANWSIVTNAHAAALMSNEMKLRTRCSAAAVATGKLTVNWHTVANAHAVLLMSNALQLHIHYSTALATCKNIGTSNLRTVAKAHTMFARLCA
eukprot:gnl/MRDRNA2_/MRDRNA2_23009_c0_seq2.p1 gnl/MRDRNA2_/MRDRNA2_23009_c0~~gnl/MRDRNA2_/MRDRNA2_23009_c0_seq2.p1  ORF type:complete len:127 (+),score=22.00 gnl/MRDRNA2_/MRDRNA2_23009_c0_seq2:36-416(+)